MSKESIVITHTADVDELFVRNFPKTCERIGCKPLDLLGVIFSESQCKAHAINRNPLTKLVQVGDKLEERPTTEAERYNAVGLIQFMPATLRGLGWRDGFEAFRHLTAGQQLPYVAAYFAPWQKDGAPFDSAARLYQACFLPATLKELRAPDDVLCARAGRLGWAFEANAVFDANRDGRITIAELGEAVQRNARGARFLELAARLGIEVPPHELRDVDGDGVPEIVTTLDVQTALARIGLDVGDVDGIDGPKTRAAVRRFQKEHELTVDGIIGPKTRRALGIAVATAA